MYDLIFGRLAAMRAAANARAQRIHDRAAALESRRRELHARTDANRHLAISPVAEPAGERRGAESSVSVSADA